MKKEIKEFTILRLKDWGDFEIRETTDCISVNGEWIPEEIVEWLSRKYKEKESNPLNQ